MTTTDATPTEATPAATTNASGISLEKVQEVLNMVRPYLQNDGGDVELVGVTDDNVVQLRLQGACGTCPSSVYTLKLGIEEQLKQYIPEIKEVQQVS